jgi:hypothetical protein
MVNFNTNKKAELRFATERENHNFFEVVRVHTKTKNFHFGFGKLEKVLF